MKIVYCTNSLSKKGGTEHITIAKASRLAQIPGNSVWIAVSDSLESSFPVDERVILLNLGINYYEGTSGDGRFLQFLKLLYKQRVHKRKLKRLMEKISPDVVLSTGGLEKLFLPYVCSSSQVLIREIHTASDSRMFYARTPYERITARLGDLLDYRIFIKKYDCIVLLTEEDKNRCWKDNPKAFVIPNFYSPNHFNLSPLNQKRVVSVGKLSMGKNFAALIRSWKIVHDRHPDWALMILGDGEEKTRLQDLIANLNLNDSISLIGCVDDVGPYLEHSSIFAFSSLSEGLSLVIIEAMASGLPVVSYDCPCGPKDIITEGENGFLVPVVNETLLANRICYLIENDDDRKRMGELASKNAERFSIDIIMERWLALFDDLLSKKPQNR